MAQPYNTEGQKPRRHILVVSPGLFAFLYGKRIKVCVVFCGKGEQHGGEQKIMQGEDSPPYVSEGVGSDAGLGGGLAGGRLLAV